MTTPMEVHRKIDRLMDEYETVFRDPWPNAQMYGISPEQMLIMLDRAIKNRRPYQNTQSGVDY